MHAGVIPKTKQEGKEKKEGSDVIAPTHSRDHRGAVCHPSMVILNNMSLLTVATVQMQGGAGTGAGLPASFFWLIRR